jgi:hypothetical protein
MPRRSTPGAIMLAIAAMVRGLFYLSAFIFVIGFFFAFVAAHLF